MDVIQCQIILLYYFIETIRLKTRTDLNKYRFILQALRLCQKHLKLKMLLYNNYEVIKYKFTYA